MRSQARASRGRADRSRMITGTEVVQDLVTAMGASGAEESRGAHSTAETQRGGGKRGEDLERTGRSCFGVDRGSGAEETEHTENCGASGHRRSEEHTSELQSRFGISYAV